MANTPALGVTLPLKRGNGGYFQQAFDIRSQVRSNLTNLILTRRGERPLQPTFGSDIYRVIFEPISDNNKVEIRAVIEQATKIWMPYVRIESVDVTQDEHTIFAQIAFSINNTVPITDSIILAFTA